MVQIHAGNHKHTMKINIFKINILKQKEEGEEEKDEEHSTVQTYSVEDLERKFRKTP